ncbi:MAG: hypothetical protein GY793_09090, partial [Proteobacteria bacterium]|nr:hypothetical protein [Pseudomonadota bacterium]
STNTADYLQIGRAWLGEYYTTSDIGTTLDSGKNRTDLITRSVSGQTYTDKRYSFESVNTNFPAITHTQKKELFDLLDIIDGAFFVQFDENCLDLDIMYATLSEQGLDATILGNTDYYAIDIGFRQEV